MVAQNGPGLPVAARSVCSGVFSVQLTCERTHDPTRVLGKRAEKGRNLKVKKP